MRIKFWGVRGSIATPERRNSNYGGNTSCVEVRLDNGTLIILDCGTGFRALGKSLHQEFGERPLGGYIFLTHLHWDHISGIPFFLPFYNPRNHFFIHSVAPHVSELEAAVHAQMNDPYFPVGWSTMGSTRHFFALDGSPIVVNGAIVSTAPLHHPQGCFAFKIEADGRQFVFATDTEPGSPMHDRAIREFVQGVDVLVYDAQYTPEQLMHEKRGYGHSSWHEGVQIARQAGVKHLILSHHDPDNDDHAVDTLVERARAEFPSVFGAAEGMQVGLSGDRVALIDYSLSSHDHREHLASAEVSLQHSRNKTTTAAGKGQRQFCKPLIPVTDVLL